MKKIYSLFTLAFLFTFTIISCGEDGIDGFDGDKGIDGVDGIDGETTSFRTKAKIDLPNGGNAHVAVYDTITNTLYALNKANNTIEIIDLTDITAPIINPTPLDLSIYGDKTNSIAHNNNYLALAFEATTSTDDGSIVIFDTSDLTTPYHTATTGALPKMITFTPDGNYILSANEGKPNDDYTIDPLGTISIIDVVNKTEVTVDFTSFNSYESNLALNGFRVFGPGADLAKDVEPEYITISDDSSTAFITLQENNGIAKFDIITQTLDTIYPLGTKNLLNSYYDLSDTDRDVGNFQSWPVSNFYQPNNIDFFTSNGTDYVITANEGEIRDYTGFTEKEILKNVTINPSSPLFGIDELNIPDATDQTNYINWLKEDENIGSFKVTNANGSDRIHGFGGRSFSIWSTSGELVYDSGNELSLRTYNLGSYPERKSDEKGVQPKSIKVYTAGGNNFAAIGLQGNGDVLIYKITDIYNPVFVQRLTNTAPENILVVNAEDSPNKRTMLIVSNNNSSLNIYTL